MELQGPAPVASGKASPHVSCSGASRDSSPVDAGAYDLVWSQCRNLRIPLQCRHGSSGTSGVSQGRQTSARVGACTCAFLPSCSSSVTLPFVWIKGSVAFPRGFPKRLSHEAFPQGCPTCHCGVSRSSARKSRQCRENWFPWNGMRHLGDSANGGTTLEFLSPFLWRAPHLEMRRECREFIPHHTGKGSLLSSYEADTGILWM